MNYTRADYEQAAETIRQATPLRPTVGIVLGSGLGGLVSAIEHRVNVPYEAIPGMPVSTVPGHQGQFVLGELEGQTVICQQGRTHFYEGYTMAQVTFAIRVMAALGIQTLCLTNAAGGVNPSYRAGDLMLLNDHINFIGLAGHNPLIGPNDESLGPRFVGMAQAYERPLREAAKHLAAEQGIPLHEGVYAAVSGPMFESPAEIRMLRTLGADAVGMSTVHEVLVARHMGLRVLAISGITNECIDSVDTTRETNHEEVLETGLVLVPRLTALMRGVLRQL